MGVLSHRSQDACQGIPLTQQSSPPMTMTLIIIQNTPHTKKTREPRSGDPAEVSTNYADEDDQDLVLYRLVVVAVGGSECGDEQLTDSHSD